MNYKIIEGAPSEENLNILAKLGKVCFDARQYDSSRLKYEFESKGSRFWQEMEMSMWDIRLVTKEEKVSFTHAWRGLSLRKRSGCWI